MFNRQRSGAVVCPSCGKLVGVADERCYNCGRRNPGMWGFASVFRRVGRDLGFVQLVIGGCILLYGLMLLADPSGIRTGGLFNLFAPSPRSLFTFGASGAVPVFQAGRWWTFLSAGWLHAGLLHIFFNMMWVRDLAPQTAELYGPARMVIIYTVASVTGFAASTLVGAFLPFLGGAPLTVGASAAIFGLLAALVHYGRRGGSSLVGRQAWSWAIALFVLGFVMSGVDNWAHLGGFAGGYAAARILDPLREERTDHTLAALVCLVLTAASILASVLTVYL